MVIRKQICLCLLALLLFGCLLPGEGHCQFSKRTVSTSVCGLCGQPLEGEIVKYENGPAYHRDCHARAAKCSLCGIPISKFQEVKYDAGKNSYHAACYARAPVCAQCGQPIGAGQPYRKDKQNDTKWHKNCFERADFCGITGHYIRPGAKTVRIGSEVFLKTEYDQAQKCLVSGLPLANHGRFIENRRSNTFVLDKYKSKVRQCYSCGDWLPEGYLVKDDFFLCTFCYQHGVKTRQQAGEHLTAAKNFFSANGIRVPDNIDIVILKPGQLIRGQTNTNMKGACHTEARVVWKKVSYNHTIEILYGLNVDRFKTVLVHELSHAVIAEEIKYVNGKEQPVSYEEGRCEFAAYKFAMGKQLPGYIIEGFATNQVAEYRNGFLHFARQNPATLKSVFTIR